MDETSFLLGLSDSTNKLCQLCSVRYQTAKSLCRSCYDSKMYETKRTQNSNELKLQNPTPESTFGLLPHTETMKKIYNLLFFNNLVHLTIIMNFCNTSKLFANIGDLKFVKLKEKQCRLR